MDSLKLESIQRHLEHLYRLIPTPSIQHYLIHPEEWAQTNAKKPLGGPQVLIAQQGEDVRLGVHLGKEVLERLESKTPKQVDLPALMSATEEISHFLFLVWSLLNSRPVSLLDIEVQGEIDKFLLASELIPNQQTLLNVLFGHPDYDPSLSKTAKARYEEANKLGRKFCAFFMKALKKDNKGDSLRQLRNFYRMNSQARLSHISLL